LTITADVRTLPEWLDVLNVTPGQLAKSAGLSKTTVRRNLDMSDDGLKTHLSTLHALATALGISTRQIRLPRGTSQTGRNAGDYTVPNSDVVPYASQSVHRLCPSCFIELPATNICDDCS